MAGLVPATPFKEARPCHMIGVAGTSPAMTPMSGTECRSPLTPRPGMTGINALRPYFTASSAAACFATSGGVL